MKPILLVTISLLASGFPLPGLTVAQESEEGSTGRELREVIVSHTDENGILQLYRMKEDGSASTQLTNSQFGCRMPACSPDGRKLVYVEQTRHGLSLWLSDLGGKNAKALIEDGRNLVPSWLPDSKHIVWMITQPGQDPSRNSQIHLMNTETGESRRLFADPEQLKFSNSMPVVSPKGDRIAFVSNRSGDMRIWVSDLDGSNARLISRPEMEYHEAIKAPIEQKVPAWSPDGKWIAHWEGVEMVHLSKFTGVADPKRDRMISETFHVWVVGSDGKNRRKVGRGDDPTWSPDGFVTRAFPDPQRGGPKVMIETESGEKELPIVPHNRNWGRFAWVPQKATSQARASAGSIEARGQQEDATEANSSIRHVVIEAATAETPRSDTASIAELSDGRLMVVYHKYERGKHSGHDHGICRIWSKVSNDGGRSWQHPRMLVDVTEGDMNVQAPALLRLKSGLLLLICLRAHQGGDSSTMCLFSSEDEGRSFSPLKPVWERSKGQLLQGGASSLVELRSGRLLLPLHGGSGNQWRQKNSAWCFTSDDRGQTWQRSTTIDLPKRGAMEASVAELADGSLLMSLRTQLGGPYLSRSSDGGKTWSEPIFSGLEGGESCTCLRRIPGTNDIVLFWNNSQYNDRHHHFGERTPLTVAISSDHGKSWRIIGDLADDPKAEYTNLDCFFTSKGDALVTYMYAKPAWNRNQIHLRAALIPRTWFHAAGVSTR